MTKPTEKDIRTAWEVLFYLKYNGKRSHADIDKLRQTMRLLKQEA